MIPVVRRPGHPDAAIDADLAAFVARERREGGLLDGTELLDLTPNPPAPRPQEAPATQLPLGGAA